LLRQRQSSRRGSERNSSKGGAPQSPLPRQRLRLFFSPYPACLSSTRFFFSVTFNGKSRYRNDDLFAHDPSCLELLPTRACSHRAALSFAPSRPFDPGESCTFGPSKDNYLRPLSGLASGPRSLKFITARGFVDTAGIASDTSDDYIPGHWTWSTRTIHSATSKLHRQQFRRHRQLLKRRRQRRSYFDYKYPYYDSK